MIEGRYSPQALSLLRIVAALIFLLHGSQKLIGFPAGQMPMPPAGSFMWFGGVLELVGGLLLLIGLFSRPVAFQAGGDRLGYKQEIEYSLAREKVDLIDWPQIRA